MRKTNDRINFTKRALDAVATPKEARAVYHDTQERGLGLLVQPTGHKSFFWFRKVRGRPTWKTIGAFPDLSIENARAKAQEYNSSVARWKADEYAGPAPLERRKSPTLGSILDDYLERHLKANAKNPDRAVKHTRWQFNRYLSAWKDRKLGEISRDDVRALHSEIGSKDGKSGPKTGKEKEVELKHGRYSANRVIGLVRVLFNWALNPDVSLWHGENPAKGIKRFREEKRTRFTQPDEMPRLFKALRAEKNIDLRDFVFLALFTGARRSDVLAMRWDNLDLQRGLWEIPDPKNREPYTVVLIAEAVTVLCARRRITAKSEWVFPSESSKSGHLLDVKRGWKKLRQHAELSDLRIHDLRRTLGSWQAGSGSSLPIIGKSLGHSSSQATEIYSRLHLDPVRASVETATAAILAAGKIKSGKLLEASK